MPHDFEMGLLELSSKSSRIELAQLSRMLHANTSTAKSALGELQDEGIVSVDDGVLEVTPFQRMMLAESLIRRGQDPRRVSRWLHWQEFENFASRRFEENGFKTVIHLIFRSKAGRREVDLLAWNDTLTLSVDCKHWLHGLSAARLHKAIEAQIERTQALAQNPDILAKRGLRILGRRILPMLLALSQPSSEIVAGVPVVCVSKLISFLNGVSPIDEKLRMILVRGSESKNKQVVTEGLI